MAQRILGLDIGSQSIKAIVIDSAYRTWSVAATRELPVPPATESDTRTSRERQLEAVRVLLSDPPLTFDSAIVALPGPSATHVVTLPFTDQKRIEQTIGFEVESQIPFDLSDAAWDWQSMQIRDGKSDLLVSVVKREELATLLAGLGEAGVDPRIVIPPGPAYASLFESGVFASEPSPEPSPGPEEPTGSVVPSPAEALLDVGASRSALCIVANGVCELARTFPSGAAQPAAAIAREVRASLRAWRSRTGLGTRSLQRLLLAGAGPRVTGLAEALTSEVDGRVEPISFVGGAGEKISPEEAPSFALALALALRGQQGAHAPRLNLRRGDLAFTRDFEHVRGKVLRLAAWASLILCLGVLSSVVKIIALSRQERALDRALCDVTKSLTGKCIENDELAVAALRGKGTAAAAIPKYSALDILVELSHRVPQGTTLKFDRVEITRDKLHLQGVTDAAPNVDGIVTGLRASQCFGAAHSGGARKRSSDGKFEFTVDSDLTCDTGEKPAGKG